VLTLKLKVIWRSNETDRLIFLLSWVYLLVVYVDYIILRNSDKHDISLIKQYVYYYFQTKDLGKLRYLTMVLLSFKKKYALDILEKTELVNSKFIDTLMDPNVKLLPSQREPLSNPGKYRRLVEKLNYLTLTRSDVSFAVSVVSQFINFRCVDHWNAIIIVLKYIKGSPEKGLLYDHNNHNKVICYSDVDWTNAMIIWFLEKVKNMLWQDLVLK